VGAEREVPAHERTMLAGMDLRVYERCPRRRAQSPSGGAQLHGRRGSVRQDVCDITRAELEGAKTTMDDRSKWLNPS
jgi:hypothetical protein